MYLNTYKSYNVNNKNCNNYYSQFCKEQVICNIAANAWHITLPEMQTTMDYNNRYFKIKILTSLITDFFQSLYVAKLHIGFPLVFFFWTTFCHTKIFLVFLYNISNGYPLGLILTSLEICKKNICIGKMVAKTVPCRYKG